MTLGQRINTIRNQKNLTLKELSEKSYIPLPTICSWIYNDAHPDVMLLARVADVLDVSLDYLVGRKFP